MKGDMGMPMMPGKMPSGMPPKGMPMHEEPKKKGKK